MAGKYEEIVKLVRNAADIAEHLGISNILQPGLVKEMIIADHLGHSLIHSKREADAYNPDNPGQVFEYLSCKEGGSGQLDRMFKHPPEKRANSLTRITRNHKIYFAVFYSKDQTRCKVIYELDPLTVLEETERQLDASQNDISHVGFSIKWASDNGVIVYQDI